MVRKFRSAAMERAFRTDYARRYARQRRLAGASLMLIWIAFTVRVGWLLRAFDSTVMLHVVYARLAGGAGMAASLALLWSTRALDERQAVRLLCGVVVSCWFAQLVVMEVYPPRQVFEDTFPEFFVIALLMFTTFRLRAITAAWLVGLCVVAFRVTIYLWLRQNASSSAAHVYSWLSRGNTVSIMYLAGVVVCIQFELAARREFVFRQTLRAAKARVEAASRVIRQQNERMRELVREKERFFSAAYHDIQQPLAAINLFIRSARMKLEDEYAATRDLDVIEETARDILDMFKDIQDYSELGSYTPRVGPVDTQAVLTEVFEQYVEPATSRGLEFRVSLRRQYAPAVASDRALLKRVLSNFVSNAIRNTLAGGVAVGWVKLGERLRIDVWDTGVGIAPVHREAIFNEYYQIDNPGRDRSKGLGLGLSIVHRVVGILPGHSMSFRSVEGRGSRFSIYAPISDVPPVSRKEDRRDGADVVFLKGRYVLLCDDEPTVLEGLRRLFSNAGALVDTAGSMTDIEAILSDEGRAPDVVVTDIRLRDGQTGIEIARRVRQHFAWAGVLPVAFITGELLSPRALREFATPFVLLRKSSSPEHTLAEVSRLVAAQTSTDPGHTPDL